MGKGRDRRGRKGPSQIRIHCPLNSNTRPETRTRQARSRGIDPKSVATAKRTGIYSKSSPNKQSRCRHPYATTKAGEVGERGKGRALGSVPQKRKREGQRGRAGSLYCVIYPPISYLIPPHRSTRHPLHHPRARSISISSTTPSSSNVP